MNEPKIRCSRSCKSYLRFWQFSDCAIFGDPGAVSACEGKSKRRGKIGKEKLEKEPGAPSDGVLPRKFQTPLWMVASDWTEKKVIFIILPNSEGREWRYNSDKQNVMVEDLKLFQAGEQAFLKQFLYRKFGVHFPPISLRTRLRCLTFAGFQ